MERIIEKANTLVEALPYIREFHGKTVLVKYGGSAMEDDRIKNQTAQDIVLMKYVGMNPVVVHGGGKAISAMMKRLGMETTFHQGLRVTDEKGIEVAEMVLVGMVNKEIVSSINLAGGNAVGLSGKDSMLLEAEKLEQGEDSTHVDIGYVGEVRNVHADVLEALENAGCIPVIAPIATDKSGNTWNVNADAAAAKLAVALQAEKLVFLSDTPGILENPEVPDTLLSVLTLQKAEQLVERGIIAGGMIPKVKACTVALEGGVSKTHIIDGRLSHALLLEIFTKEGIGTVVTR